MPTRCQLRFVSAAAFSSQEACSATTAQVYKHLDGDPSSILRALNNLANLLDTTGTLRTPAQTAAQFIFLTKLRTMALCLDRASVSVTDTVGLRTLAQLDRPLCLLGHGVEHPAAGVRGDEEFLYLVGVPDHETSPDSEWQVRVSERRGFVRSGPGEHSTDPFRTAHWQYEGPLVEAMDVFGLSPAGVEWQR
jgi:hypothetical protein